MNEHNERFVRKSRRERPVRSWRSHKVFFRFLMFQIFRRKKICGKKCVLWCKKTAFCQVHFHQYCALLVMFDSSFLKSLNQYVPSYKFLCVCVFLFGVPKKAMHKGKKNLHPWRLTWNIIMEVWKIIFLSKWVICRFHVNLPGCNRKKQLVHMGVSYLGLKQTTTGNRDH